MQKHRKYRAFWFLKGKRHIDNLQCFCSKGFKDTRKRRLLDNFYGRWKYENKLCCQLQKQEEQEEEQQQEEEQENNKNT